MRRSRALPLALAGGVAFALAATSPAAAASVTWVSPSDSWWSVAGPWSGGAIAAVGDEVTFAGGIRSTYNLGNVTFASFHFTNEHTIANGGGAIGLTNGLTIDAGAPVRIEPSVTTAGAQSWLVAPGASLTLPSQVNVDPASTLTLQIDGTVDVTTGNLDGGGAACIVKSGSGVLRFAGGGGGVGACGADPEGLQVQAGEVQVAPGANLGGKSFRVAGAPSPVGRSARPPSCVSSTSAPAR